MKEAKSRFRTQLNTRSFTVEQAAARYRERRGRHPPPGFDKWFEQAKKDDAVIVEDFFDRIHHDINPFWALKPADLRNRTSHQPQVIRIRKGKTWFVTDDPDREPWIQLWTALVKEMMPHIPDLDMVINFMDESRVLVPWEKISEYVKTEQSQRKLISPEKAISTYSGLNDAGSEKEKPYDPGWITEDAPKYWEYLRKACPPRSPGRKAAALKSFNVSIDYPRKPLPYMMEGFVKNFTQAQDPCLQPHLRGMHGTFIESVSISTTLELFPMFGGSKLPQNNELLIPGAMYLSDRAFYSGGAGHGPPWGDKSGAMVWRGTASGGRNKKDNWWHFHRHRWVQMLNGTTVAAVGSGDSTRGPTFKIPGDSQLPEPIEDSQRLSQWISSVADVAFVNLECFPSEETEIWPLKSHLPMKKQYDYKLLPDVDGNSFSGRWRAFLQSTSLPLKSTIYTEWHDDRIVPWLHFVPFDNSYMDIYAIMHFFLEEDEEAAKEIAGEARTLLDILNETTASHHQAAALDDGIECLSYSALAARVTTRAARVTTRAARLRALGVGVGDRVGVRVRSGTAELYVSVLSVLACGAAYVPVDADDPDGRAEMVWAEAGVCIVLSTDETVTKLREPKGKQRWPTIRDDAWIIFTSGSTGKPKGVAVTHLSAAAFIHAEAQSLTAILPSDRVLASLSVSFDASCEEMWLAWRNGACLVPASRALVRAGAELGLFLASRVISVVSTVPTLAALWPDEALRRVRLLILGGEACSSPLVTRLAGPGRCVWKTDGPTEATVVSSVARLEVGEPVRIGLPLPGWTLAVVGPDGQPVQWGQPGELIIGGAGIARYLDAELDSKRMAPALGWKRAYRTGDIVRVDRAGLVFLGRGDDQVKLAGRRVEQGEIDAALADLLGVRAAACAVRSSETGDDLLIGYIVREDEPTSADREILLLRLSGALVSLLARVDGIPMKTSGKADRAALPLTLPGSERRSRNLSLSGTEGWLAEQRRLVLGNEPAGSEDDLFELGATSLSVVQLISLLRRRCPTLSVKDLYSHPTLGDMAALIDGQVETKHAARVMKPMPRFTGFIQVFVIIGILTLEGLRWLVILMTIAKVTSLVQNNHDLWITPLPSWWQLVPAWMLLISIPGRVLVTAFTARLLTASLRPGRYPRGGAIHLGLWAAERLVETSAVSAVTGTHWCRRYARLLECRVGEDAQLHSGIVSGATEVVPELGSGREDAETQLPYDISLAAVEALQGAVVAAPALIIFPVLLALDSPGRQAVLMLALSIPATAASVLGYAGLVAVLIRFASRHLQKVGRGVEASTVVTIPSLLEVGDGAFLADDVLLAPYRLAAGRLHIGSVEISTRALVGNWAMVDSDNPVPDGALIGVLATAPPAAEAAASGPGSAWLGRPAIPLPYRLEPGERSQTHDPPIRLVLARAFIESWRLLPLVLSALLADAVAAIVIWLVDVIGILGAAASEGILPFGGYS
ncbi:hypothetical protein CDD80_1815 [Ophiocordyceps camponoti-rufipedis]|uniref:Carrier domain-containing protein n=1 Tax=Ophiocordyceps camponoti-rufipedis TaxID=2004952 RepID=A0A2C5ZKP5_9HYPO|nr:hypothetical protein CDD80_1815 [Ophiocordyceps camponoti-rufipedis]